jgi:AmpE protein
MILLCLLTALVLLQWFDVANRLQKDQWFYNWLDWLSAKISNVDNSLLFPLLALALPLLGLSIGLALLAKINVLLVFLASIALLLYSFGRGNWANSVDELRSACRSENINAIYERVANWLPKSHRDKFNWREQAVAGIAYHAFERTFAVLFWFLLLGPVGAVLYRLSVLLQNYKGLRGADRGVVERWQWLLEWPAVRLLGLSFAIVGNFAGCYHQWKISALCVHSKTQTVLYHYIQGASMLHSESGQYGPIYSGVRPNDVEIDIDTIIELYNRALLFWTCILAISWII